MIKLTEHYKNRYKERVSKSSKNMQLMADRAFKFGTNLDEVQNSKVKKEIENRTRTKNNAPWVKCKIYRGYVWWFSATTILTVYTLPIIRNICK